MELPNREAIIFEPLAMERVWGGRRMETLYKKSLPQGTPIGELWEMVDRPEAQSVVHSGPLRGKTLHDLWTKYREPIFGSAHKDNPAPRFPLLIKLLDARERLSVQVHPPAHVAPSLGGEPKTEMWYFLNCLPQASIYAGIKNGVTREAFEQLLHSGNVESALHRMDVQSGDSIFIPSGRLHAIGEGNVIVEIQQNSDTTYRVFDWNRVGLDGQPRKLHIEHSLLSIDFEDFEPKLNPAGTETLADCTEFQVRHQTLEQPQTLCPENGFAIATVTQGAVRFGAQTFTLAQFFLIPSCASATELEPLEPGTKVLHAVIPD